MPTLRQKKYNLPLATKNNDLAGDVTQSINDIWKAIRKGDTNAWRQLVTRYEALVNTVALNCGLTASDAEDCAQHTWLSLYRNRHTIREPERVPFWLIQTTRRRAIRMKSSSKVSSGSIDELANPEPLERPDEELIRLERKADLETALSQLDDRCRRLIEELFFAPKEKSYREIATELGIPPNSLGPIRSRCLKKLRKILLDMGCL